MTRWGDIDSFCAQYGFYFDSPIQDLIIRGQDKLFDEIPHWDAADEMDDCSFILDQGDRDVKRDRKLSTDQKLKLAAARFLQFSSKNSTDPYCFSPEDKQDVELAQLLLASAEKVSNKEIESARKLLGHCQWIASSTGTPVQRIVFYFAEALMGRISGGLTTSAEEVNSCLSREIIAPFTRMYRLVPFYQILHLTSVQTILENTDSFSKVHIIDFHMMSGTLWAAFMKSWAEKISANDLSCFRLKITAVETQEKDCAANAGKLLRSFARCLNLPFTFRVVSVKDMMDLKEEDLGIEPNEGVALHIPFRLRALISKPVCLKNLMSVVQKVNPSVMVVEEVEANHNSPSFINRFVEALFFYGALFDSLEDSTSRENLDRMGIESTAYREGLRNIVAMEGEERETRSVSMRVWRAFFARFGMVEMELSTASLSQACMILNQFPCGRSCTIDISSKCMIVGWKGTPLFSLSAWKFN